MTQSRKTCNALGGRIRAKCPRCGRTVFMEVPTGSRQKIVRCSCGKSTCYQVNHRKATRGSAFTKAFAIFGGNMETNIRLCDTSEFGVGFIIGNEHARSLRLGQELNIKYRSSGLIAQRKIRVRNVNGNRIGAEYA